ncbi:MAG: hypothetical protein U1E76_19320 [Planctomycetota bacterium]
MPMSLALQLCPRRSCCRAGCRSTCANRSASWRSSSASAPVVEPLSLDEAFLDVRGTERLFGQAREVRCRDPRGDRGRDRAHRIGRHRREQVPGCSSVFAKPNGVCEIRDDEKVARLAVLPVRMLFGVGRRTEQLLTAAGIRTIGDVQRASEASLRQVVGSNGAWRCARSPMARTRGR